MTGMDAYAEIRVRPLVFGDPTLIRAIRIASMIAELEELFGSESCCDDRCCGWQFVRMDEQTLIAHLQSPRARALLGEDL